MPPPILHVAELACAVADDWGHECGGRITCHHPIGYVRRRMGQKAPDDCVIPLCDAHRQHSSNAIHLMGKKPWGAKYGNQRELLEATLVALEG